MATKLIGINLVAQGSSSQPAAVENLHKTASQPPSPGTNKHQKTLKVFVPDGADIQHKLKISLYISMGVNVDIFLPFDTVGPLNVHAAPKFFGVLETRWHPRTSGSRFPDFTQEDFVPDVADIRHKLKISVYIACRC